MMTRSTARRLAVGALLASGLVACGGTGKGREAEVSGTALSRTPAVVTAGVPARSLTCALVTKRSAQAAVASLVPHNPVKDVRPKTKTKTSITCEIRLAPVGDVTPHITVEIADTYRDSHGHDASLQTFEDEKDKARQDAHPGMEFNETYSDETGIGEAAYYLDTAYHDDSGTGEAGRQTQLFVHRTSGPFFLTVTLTRDRTSSVGDAFSKEDVRKGVLLALAKLYGAKIPAS
jgi:hypothetical protein